MNFLCVADKEQLHGWQIAKAPNRHHSGLGLQYLKSEVSKRSHAIADSIDVDLAHFPLA